MRVRALISLPRVVLPVASVLAVAGCSGHPDTGYYPSELVEQRTEEVLTEAAGRSPDDLDCPDPLPARLGATGRCTLTVGGARLGVTVSLSEPREGATTELGLDVQV